MTVATAASSSEEPSGCKQVRRGGLRKQVHRGGLRKQVRRGGLRKQVHGRARGGRRKVDGWRQGRIGAAGDVLLQHKAPCVLGDELEQSLRPLLEVLNPTPASLALHRADEYKLP